MKSIVIGFAIIIASYIPLIAVEITLKDSVVIQGDLLTLGDIADISSHEQEQGQLKALPIRRLLDLSEYTISADEVQRLVRRHFAQAIVNPGESSVMRASEQLAGTELSDYAIKDLRERAKDRQIEVRVRRSAMPQIIAVDPVHPIVVRAEPLTSAWWGDVPYRLRIMQGDREVARTLCVLEVNAWREIPVAVRGIERGAELSLQDIVLQRVHISPGRGDRDVSVDQVVGMVAQRFIPAGTPISPKWARPPLDIEQGNVVVLTYDGGGFTLSVHAEALNDGRVGDRVLVRVNKGSPVEAEIVGPSEVRMRDQPPQLDR